jgi:hypothetical protein
MSNYGSLKGHLFLPFKQSCILRIKKEKKNDVMEKFACLKKDEKENEGQCHYLGTHIIIARFNGTQ